MAEKSERPTKNMDTVDAELQIGLLPGMRQEADASNSDRPDPVGNHAQDKRTSSEKYASRSIRLRKVTYVYRRQAGQVACFKEYPVTVTMMYAAHGVFSLTSMSAVRSTISNFNLGSPSPINSVGQIISLVVAAATLGRAAFRVAVQVETG
ncbi:hypothetical protein F5883DRAFT_642855 [Diaporthe sp. PMI_573]|nr:hypothetical protein F5883DRAFT_642855 [Diaporthaceae sp. PMI_573]